MGESENRCSQYTEAWRKRRQGGFWEDCRGGSIRKPSFNVDNNCRICLMQVFWYLESTEGLQLQGEGLGKLQLSSVHFSSSHSSTYPTPTLSHMAGSCAGVLGAVCTQLVGSWGAGVGKKDLALQILEICAQIGDLRNCCF